jgi:hypothetical protein
MTIGYLEYPLVKGYIHNWIVAGPYATEVKDLERFTGAEWKLQIARHYYQPEPAIEGEPAEYGNFKAGDFEGAWNYVRTKDDHFVDVSKFYHLTHYLRAWAYAELSSPVEQTVTFTLTTNGPADVWINDQHVHRQEHFYHQIPNRVKFTASLTQGINRLLIRFEEVAARECPYSLALHLESFQAEAGAEDKVVRVPTAAPAPDRRMRLEKLFEASHLYQDVYAREEPVRLHLPQGEQSVTDFNVRLQNHKQDIYAEAFHVRRLGDAYIELPYPFQVPEDEYEIVMMPTPREYYELGLRISRTYNVYASNRVYSTQPYGTYAQRRQECLDDAARRDNGIFSEIAKMELGRWDKISTTAVLDALDGINRRKDCSDFYLCGLLGMVYRYADKPEFPPSLKQPLEDCILNFKYWDDEPGSDAMCYRTENHSLLFHACEILAGQLYPERVFTNVNQPGSWHIEKGERLARAWLRNRASSGFKEWDSNCYFEEDTLSLTTLASLAKNGEIWEMAAIVLDKMFFTMAVNSFKGVFGSTHGRTYTPFIKTGFREGTAPISRLLWGMGIFNDHLLGGVSLAVSSYELPPIIEAIAVDQMDEMWDREQHAGSQEDFGTSGSANTTCVNKVTYKTPDYMLASAQDWRPGEKGYQQHIWQATLSPHATIFTSHPPCAAEDGSHRPNFWHGNDTLPRVAQWKDVLVAVYNLPEDDWMGFTHAYFPAYAFTKYEVRDGWAFAQVDNGYIALTAAKGLEFITQGDNAFRELRSEGTPNVWLVQMGRAALDGTFEEFTAKVLAMPVKFGAGKVDLTGLRGDKIAFGWKGAFKVNGKAQKLSDFKHYENPFCTAELGADTMEIQYGLDAMKLHFAPAE